MRFEWDENKNQLNFRKHCINFCDAAYVFSDPYALSISDNEHSETEERWILLGQNINNQTLLVVHTFRCADVIRIISARKATANEKATYMKRLRK
jgi:uncharacterized DUF497 family protein